MRDILIDKLRPDRFTATWPRCWPRRSARATAIAARRGSRPRASRRLKTLGDFDFTVETSVSRTTIAHLAQLEFLAEAHNVVFLGPPGTGKTHLSIALGVAAARRAQRVAFVTAHSWVNRLGAAKRAGRLYEELERQG